jgi:hypothetical protein
MIIFLVLLPFILAYGTGNPIFYVAIGSMWAWGLAAIILFSVVGDEMNLFLKYATFLLLPVVMFTLSLRFIVHRDYKIGGGIDAYQHKVSSLPKARGLLFDQETASFLTNVYHILYDKGQYESGEPILGLYNLNKIVYLMGGYSPGWIFYNKSENPIKDHHCLFIELADSDLKNSIIVTSEDIHPDLLNCMKTAGIDFPNQYVQLGSLLEPYTDRTIRFYSPK